MTGGPADSGPPDRDIQAAEYVLGTLPRAERLAFARALATEADLQAAVARWQTRLAPLAETVPAVGPRRASGCASVPPWVPPERIRA